MVLSHRVPTPPTVFPVDSTRKTPSVVPLTSDVGAEANTVTKGDWNDFSWSTTDEPHATRRKIILEKHPEIRSLFVKEPRTFWMTLSLVCIQLTLAYKLQDASYWLILPLAYVIGGTINHSLQLAVHELSHNLCWESQIANKFTAMLANIPTGFPSCITFQRYHMDHHQYQGVDGIDTDIPHWFEVNYFTNTIAKALWIALQPFCYALRPSAIRPKSFTKWELINWIVQLSFNGAMLYFFGLKAMSYLMIGTIVGLGLHPAAGHFIAEHYEFVTGQETYSYYGFCNYLNFNVGYHNEHHDFPRIPWSKLPEVKRLAPEYYDTLPSYSSYVAVFWRYITDPTLGPFSRIKRQGSETTYRLSNAQQNHSTGKPFRAVCYTAMCGVCAYIAYNVARTTLGL